MEPTQCLTPRTIRRRRLLKRPGTTDPELESLYQNEATLKSPPVTNYQPDTHLVTLGTPNQQNIRTPRRTDITQGQESLEPRSNDVFGCSLSLTERLIKIAKQDDSKKDKPKTSLDLSTYQMVPSKMEAAFFAAAAEPLFSRVNFFDDPLPTTLTTTHTNDIFPGTTGADDRITPSRALYTDDRITPSSPRTIRKVGRVSSVSSSSRTSRVGDRASTTSPGASRTDDKVISGSSTATYTNDGTNDLSPAPPSPTCSISSTATSISEQVNLSMLSWPGSPCLSPNPDKRVPNSALSFGRVNLTSRFTPPLNTSAKPTQDNHNTLAFPPRPILLKEMTHHPLETFTLRCKKTQRRRRRKCGVKKSGPLLPRRWTTVRRSRTKCQSLWIVTCQAKP